MGERTYHDPLHGAIRLDRSDPAEALAIDLIDTAPFQRLRRVRQLGPAFLTFHGAESSRFTHSLGCCTWPGWHCGSWSATIPTWRSTEPCSTRPPCCTTWAMAP